MGHSDTSTALHPAGIYPLWPLKAVDEGRLGKRIETFEVFTEHYSILFDMVRALLTQERGQNDFSWTRVEHPTGRRSKL